MRRRRSTQRAHVSVHEYEEHEQYEYDHMYGVHYAETTHHLNPAFETFDIPHHETRDEIDRSSDEHYQLVGKFLQRVKLVLRTYAVWAMLSSEDAVTVVAGLLEEVAEKTLCIQHRMIIRYPI